MPTTGAAVSDRSPAGPLPITDWLPRYRAAWLRPDLISGTTLAAYAVPNALAYALLAGLPAQTGLYCYLVGGLVYAVFGTSRQLAIGPTSSISLVVASSLAALAAHDPGRATALAGLAALLAGLISLGAWAMRWGSVVHFISETVLTGFKIGAGLVIASTQIPELLGIPTHGGGFFSTAQHLALHLGDANPTALAIGVGSFALLLAGQIVVPHWPIPLLAVASAIMFSAATHVGDRGVALVGSIPQGLPRLGLPALSLADTRNLLTLAVASFLLAYVEGVSAARTFAVKHHYRVDTNQELLALGAVNVAIGFAQGYPSAGGMSQSVVNDRGGAETPLAGAFASVWIAVILLFLTGLFRSLPQAVLAALVLASVTGLISVDELRNLRRVSRTEFGLAMVTIVGVLVLGILQGVMVAAFLSLALVIKAAASPSVSILGRVPGTRDFRDLDRHPDVEPIPGVLVIRPNAALVYFNAESVEERVLELIAEQRTKLERVVLDLSFSSVIDVSTARMLAGLHDELAERGITLVLAETHHSVRELLDAARLEEALRVPGRRISIADAIEQSAGG